MSSSSGRSRLGHEGSGQCDNWSWRHLCTAGVGHSCRLVLPRRNVRHGGTSCWATSPSPSGFCLLLTDSSRHMSRSRATVCLFWFVTQFRSHVLLFLSFFVRCWARQVVYYWVCRWCFCLPLDIVSWSGLVSFLALYRGVEL
jgi:hypothetical protein